ncbi:MAG: heparinase II/III family protein [Actinomycetota bacterium]
MSDSHTQLTSLLRSPETFWPEDDYFHRRNREKLGRGLSGIRSTTKGLDEAAIAARLLDLVAERRTRGIGSLMIMSNGGSGCHHLGILLDALAGFSFTDEVYFPVPLMAAAEGRDDLGAEVEALDLLHLGVLDRGARNDHVVNIGHLRPDATPNRLRPHMPNARFVLLLRDPVAVTTSRAFRKAEFRSASGHADSDDLDYLRRQASMTGTHFRRARSFEWDAIVRYENLVRDPVGTIVDLLDRLDLPVAAAEVETAVRMAGNSDKAAEADNRNTAARREIQADEAAILAEHLGDAATSWGYPPTGLVREAMDSAARADGEPTFWKPLFADIHGRKDAYEKLLDGRVKVFRNLPETDLPVDDHDWTADPLGNNASWRLFYHSLGWLLARDWAIRNDVDTEANLAEIESVVFSHIEANVERPAASPSAWDDHAAGDRLAVMAILYHRHLRDRLDPDRRRRYLDAMAVHVERMAAFRHDGQWLDSNHGAFHALGAINAGLALGPHPVGLRAMDVGAEYLARVVERLVDEDGVAVEQSIAYHTIDITLLRAIQPVIDDNDLDIGLDIAGTCARMVEFNYATRGRSGQRPSLGDTPHGDDHPAVGLKLLDHEPVTPPIAHLRSGGAEGEPFASPLVYEHAGLVVLRHGEPELGDETVTRTLFSLQGPRIHHGHHDQLAVVHQLDDHAVLVDSGGPYGYNEPLRFSYFVAATGHNTVLVDDEGHNGRGRLVDQGAGDGISWAIGEHDGYAPVTVRRAVVLIDGDSLVMFDWANDADTNKRHAFTSLWHFAPGSDPQLTQTRSGPVTVALDHETDPVVFGVSVGRADASIVEGLGLDDKHGPQGWVTTGLGKLDPAPVLRVRSKSAIHRSAAWAVPAGRTVTQSEPGRIAFERADGRTIDLSFDGVSLRIAD